MLKVSIITVVYNNQRFIESAIKSVLSQIYPNIEYIVIDGGSTDGTVEVIKKYRDKIAKFISEKDRGIYDAMNKGLRLATGEVVGTLNSDDIYAGEKVIETIVKELEDRRAGVCWGDLVYVRKNDDTKVIRYWKSSKYEEEEFQRGWMPPHPTFFVRREIYKKYGLFNIDFKISADYELMLRFLQRYKVRSCYIPEVLVKMRAGGVSNKNPFNIIKANVEVYRAWQINGLKINPLRIFLKPLSKLFQLRYRRS